MKLSAFTNLNLILLFAFSFSLKASGSDSLQVKPAKNQLGFEVLKPMVMTALKNGMAMEMVYTRNIKSNTDLRTSLNYTNTNYSDYDSRYGNGGCLKVGLDFNSNKNNPYVRLIVGTSVFSSYYKGTESYDYHDNMTPTSIHKVESFNAGIEEAVRFWWRIFPGCNGEVTGRANLNLVSTSHQEFPYIPGVGYGLVWNQKIFPGMEFKLLFEF